MNIKLKYVHIAMIIAILSLAILATREFIYSIYYGLSVETVKETFEMKSFKKAFTFMAIFFTLTALIPLFFSAGNKKIVTILSFTTIGFAIFFANKELFSTDHWTTGVSTGILSFFLFIFRVFLNDPDEGFRKIHLT